MQSETRQAAARGATKSVAVVLLVAVFCATCARLPYTTRVTYSDPRALVSLQHELKPAGYGHPIQFQPSEIAAILRGFSIRPKQRLPLRWFAEEAAPKPLFRADEVEVLAQPLAEGLQQAGPDERVHFDLTAPGFNPAAANDVVAGWIAVRPPWLYLSIDYFHLQVPRHRADPYDAQYYGTPPPLPQRYLLYFDPGRFWSTDASGRPALEYRGYLASPTAIERSGQTGGGRP